MTTKHTPATPLPWTDETIPGFISSKLHDLNYRKQLVQDEDYKLHACNSYPGLVEALRNTVEELTHHDLDSFGNQRRAEAILLLRLLGEDA